MNEIIEHEGVKYRKVGREAVEGDYVVITQPIQSYPLLKVGDIFPVLPDFTIESGVGISVNKDIDEYGGIHVYHSEYAVLEPLANAAKHTMPKLTDAKPGDTVRITTDAYNCDEWYEVGDTFVVSEVWNKAGGVDTVCGIELVSEEFEVVREESIAESFFTDVAAGLAQAVEMADNVKKPAHYTQGGVETIEYIEQVTAGYTDGFVAHCVGTAIKYVSRAPHKHDTPTEDLRKAREYLNFAIARLESQA